MVPLLHPSHQPILINLVCSKAYELLFQKTKLQFHSNLGLASGRVLNTLNAENCGNPVNLYLIPEILPDSESE